MEPTTTESTTEEGGLPLGLPDDAFGQVLEFLDGDALLLAYRVDRSWAGITECCGTAWRGVAGADDADTTTWGPARYLVWRARTTGIVVVELGATADRVGIAWARAPARVPVPAAIAADRAKRFQALRFQTPAARRARDDAAAVVARVVGAVAAVGLGNIEGLSLCLVSPPLASESTIGQLLAALLSAGATRARVDDATICAVAGAGASLPCVVLDVGASESCAVPVDRDGVPVPVREGAHTVHSHVHTRLRYIGFDGVAAALARQAQGLEDLNDAERAVRSIAYCRHVSPSIVPPSAEELEFCATEDGLSSARFECVEALFAEPTGIMRLICAAAARAGGDASAIVLAGGGTAVRGFGRRIRRELLPSGKHFRSTVEVIPADSDARQDLVWRGAALLARGDGRWGNDSRRTSLGALAAAKWRSSA